MATIRDRYVLEVDTQGAQSGIGGLKGGLGGITNSLKGMGPLIAGAAAGLAAFGAVGAIQDRIDDFDELAKRARAVGAANEESFESFQVLTGFLGEAGIAAGETDAILRKLGNATAQADAGVDKFADIFDKLGDSVRDANGDFLDSPALFEEVAKAVQDGTLTMAEATDLFGRSAGPNLVNILQEMAENGNSVSDALQDVAEHTNIVDIDAARNAELFNDNIGRLKEGVSQLMTDAITPLLPILVQLTEEILARAPAVIEGVQSAFAALEPVFNLIGTVLTDLVFPILGKVFDLFGAFAGVMGPIYETAIPLLSSAFQGIVSIIEKVVDAIVGLIEKISEFGNRAREIKDSVTGAFGDMAQGMTDRARGAAEGVTGWFGKMYEDLWGNSIIPDLIEGVTGGFEDMGNSIESETQSTVQNIKNGFAGIFGTVAGGLGNSIRTGTQQARNVLGDFGGTFRNIVAGITGDGAEASANLSNAFDLGGLSDDLLAGVNIGLDEFADKLQNLDLPLQSYKDQIESVNTILEISESAYQELNTAIDSYAETLDSVNEGQTSQVELLETIVEKINEYSEGVEKSIEQLENQFEAFENIVEISEQVQETFDNQKESVESLIETSENLVEQLEIETEAYQNIISGSVALRDEYTELTQSIESVMESIQNSIDANNDKRESQDQLTESINTAINSVQSYIQNLTDKIRLTQESIRANQQLAESFRSIENSAKSAAAAQATVSNQSFQSSGGGFSNPLDFFAGFFADGGFIPRGQFGLVGERGPELISGPAQITPLDGLGGGSVTYNINAVDARSFRDLLATDPGYIHALAQAGANRLPGRF
jgi:ABC-type transporter Mla subunit MlaD